MAYFVCQAGDQVVAFGSIYLNLLLHHGGKIAEIQELVVDENFRHQKIGKILAEKMIAWSRSQGALQVEVTCNHTRKSAKLFYEASGFTCTHHKLVFTYG